jgi:hypothetical protein
MENVLAKLREMESTHERRFIENSITKHQSTCGHYPDINNDLELIIEIREAITLIRKALKYEQ